MIAGWPSARILSSLSLSLRFGEAGNDLLPEGMTCRESPSPPGYVLFSNEKDTVT